MLIFKVHGAITSNGSAGYYVDYGADYGTGCGGSSGGGSINIFYDSIENCNWSSITANGGKAIYKTGENAARDGVEGGKGTITAGSISTGTFVKQ